MSTKYIQDCVEKNEQLEVEDYRLSPEITAPSTTKRAGQRSSGTSLGGNQKYILLMLSSHGHNSDYTSKTEKVMFTIYNLGI